MGELSSCFVLSSQVVGSENLGCLCGHPQKSKVANLCFPVGLVSLRLPTETTFCVRSSSQLLAAMCLCGARLLLLQQIPLTPGGLVKHGLGPRIQGF